jgi:hypothetical protein
MVGNAMVVRMKTKSMIEHSRLHRPQQPLLSRVEGIVLALGILAAYAWVAWLNSGAGT